MAEEETKTEPAAEEPTASAPAAAPEGQEEESTAQFTPVVRYIFKANWIDEVGRTYPANNASRPLPRSV